MTPPAPTLTDKLLRELGKIVTPLRSIDSEDRVKALARDLGWELPSAPPALVTAITTAASGAAAVQTALVSLSSAETDSDYVNALKTLRPALETLLRNVKGLSSGISGAEDSQNPFPTHFVSDFPKRLVDYLVVRYLEVSAPGTHATLTLLGIIETRNEPADAPLFRIRTIYWERVPQLVTNPGQLAETAYKWRSEFESDRFLENLALLMHAFSLPGGLYAQQEAVRTRLARPEDATELRVPLWGTGRWPNHAEAGIAASGTGVSGDEGNGLIVMPYLAGAQSITASGTSWDFTFTGSAALTGGIALILRPPATVEFETNILSGGGPALDVRLDAKLALNPGSAGEYFIFGRPGESLLSVKGISFRALAERSGNNSDLAFELGIEQLRLVITAGDGDGFLNKILPPDGIRAGMDLTVGWSTAKGVYFRGTGALEITIPLHAKLGPITIDSIFLRVALATGSVIQVAIAATIAAEIGPIAASVERIGLKSNLSFPSGGGNLGPAQLDSPSFLPPTGAGLFIDAGGIAGGGFLSFDHDEGRYDGVLQLRFEDIGLTAIGLINTKLPDGSPGFALLVSIGVTFSPAIQLSFGFVLSAVGGLLCINRRMEVSVLRKGLRAGTLDSILFPEDAVRDAPTIISDLRSVFPIEEGRYVIGPMVTIGWGSPTIITADIGIFIEIPSPVLIVLLGQIAARFPRPEDPVVKLNIEVLGELNIAKRKLSIDATLRDSKILTYTLSGDAALRWRWGDNALFVMSLGGFHPRFRDIPSDVDLNRLSLSLRSTSSFDLRCSVYQALTSNTLQFGARLELYAEVSKASVSGELSFDALIQFSPFEFDVEIRGSVTAEAFGGSVSLRIKISLSGPTPWDARGKASFEICCHDVDVDFHKSWGRDDKARIPAIDPLAPLLAALDRRESWSSVLPPTSMMVEALRPPDPPSATNGADASTTSTTSTTSTSTPPPPPPIVAHPTGTIEVRQKVAPLAVKLEKFGAAPIKAHNKFRLVSTVPETSRILKISFLDEAFGRAQFEDMSDDRKLSIPSFEKMQGGVSLGANASGAHGAAVTHVLEFECILVGEDGTTKKERRAPMNWDRGKRIVRGAAARRGPLRSSGRRRFERLGVSSKIGVVEESYVVARRADLVAVVTNPEGRTDRGMTRMEADRAMDQWVVDHPSDAGKVDVILAHETA